MMGIMLIGWLVLWHVKIYWVILYQSQSNNYGLQIMYGMKIYLHTQSF